MKSSSKLSEISFNKVTFMWTQFVSAFSKCWISGWLLVLVALWWAFRDAALLFASSKRFLIASFWAGVAAFGFGFGGVFGLASASTGSGTFQPCAFSSSKWANIFFTSSICRHTMSQKPARSSSRVKNLLSAGSSVFSLYKNSKKVYFWCFN